MPIISRFRFFGLDEGARWSASVAVFLVGALTISGCSDDGGNSEKNYTTPGNLCGVKTDPKLLDSFLPGGDSITVKPSTLNGGVKHCDVIVDGKIAVREIQAWWSDTESATTVAAAYANTEKGKVSDDERFVYSGVGAVGRTTEACESGEHPEQDLYGVVQVFAADRSDSDAMKELIVSYVQGLEGSGECG